MRIHCCFWRKKFQLFLSNKKKSNFVENNSKSLPKKNRSPAKKKHKVFFFLKICCCFFSKREEFWAGGTGEQFLLPSVKEKPPSPLQIWRKVSFFEENFIFLERNENFWTVELCKNNSIRCRFLLRISYNSKFFEDFLLPAIVNLSRIYYNSDFY